MCSVEIEFLKTVMSNFDDLAKIRDIKIELKKLDTDIQDAMLNAHKHLEGGRYFIAKSYVEGLEQLMQRRRSLRNEFEDLAVKGLKNTTENLIKLKDGQNGKAENNN